MSIEKNLGGDRLGSGAKIKVDLSGFGRSTFNQSRTWKSTAGVGMCIPCFMELGTNGTTFDIDINTLGHTIPTVGPLFDGYKLQVDMFACPVRLYQGILHNNAVNIGLKMQQVLFPNILLGQTNNKKSATNPSSLLNYLKIRGYHSEKRNFNAIPILAYYDIIKNYYTNKQEENAKALGWVSESNYPISSKYMFTSANNGGFEIYKGSILDQNGENIIECKVTKQSATNVYNFDGGITIKANDWLSINFNKQKTTKNIKFRIVVGGSNLVATTEVLKESENKTYFLIKKYTSSTEKGVAGYYYYDEEKNQIHARFTGEESVSYEATSIVFTNPITEYKIYDFPLENFDNARRAILAKTTLNQRITLNTDMNFLPYSLNFENDDINWLKKDFQGLCLKTYQSDIFNNWLNDENIDLINEISSISSEEGITIDAMILAKKVYNVLNRIAVSGGTYEDWQESVYGQNALRRAESPIYIGGTSAQIQFEEVVSTAQTQVADVYQPLGNLGGKGAMINKKGGSIIYKCEEPTLLMGIVSITPYVNYSQGNGWIVTNLDNMDNLHKPELDGIGFQNLIANNVHWAESPNKALAKQTAWINYQTAVDEVHGQFAIPKGEENSLYYMTLQRDYEVNENGEIQDFTTYIDPAKYNYAFADNSITAQNFWLQIGFNVKSRRVMAAYQIPNL